MLENGVVWEWYDKWLILFSFLITLGLTIWIFYDSRRSRSDVQLWRMLAAVGTVLTLPFLLARLSPSFLISVITSAAVLAYLSMLGLLLACIGMGGYLSVRSRTECPKCGQALDPAWSHCPRCGPPTVVAPPPIQEPTRHVAPPEPTHTVLIGQRKPAMAWLAVKSGSRQGTTLGLKEGDTDFGRSAKNDHPLDDPTVSSNHARIRWQDGQFILHDLASKNGTFVHGQKVDRPYPLRSGDAIKMGSTELVFMEVKDEAKA